MICIKNKIYCVVVMNFNDRAQAKIYVAGHCGLVGRALVRKLEQEGYRTIITCPHETLDLRDQGAVLKFFEQARPDYVFLAAARVGGIGANAAYPASFIYDNLAIEINVIDAAYRYAVKKLLFFGSSCIYPRLCPQPIKEEYFLSGKLEETNEPYAIAKIAGVSLCQAYNRQYGTQCIVCMPSNLYGPYDNFGEKTAHVLPALVRKFYIAKQQKDPQVVVWGTGTPRREFLYVDDVADACLFLMRVYDGSDIINVGTGTDVTIAQLAELIKMTIGYEGDIVFDARNPDGTPRKLLCVDKMASLGWRAQTSLQEGLNKLLYWCRENKVFECG